MENINQQKRYGMSWNTNMDYEVILSHTASAQAERILDYIFYELKNPQAMQSVETDMKETAERLSHTAGSLKLCDDKKLREKGYRTIHFKYHRYFMLYKIVEKQAYVVGIYHDLQDYENVLR